MGAAAAEIGTGARPLSAAVYRDELAAAGLIDIHIEPTHDAGGGILAVTIRATKLTAAVRATQPGDGPAVGPVRPCT